MYLVPDAQILQQRDRQLTAQMLAEFVQTLQDDRSFIFALAQQGRVEDAKAQMFQQADNPFLAPSSSRPESTE